MMIKKHVKIEGDSKHVIGDMVLCKPEDRIAPSKRLLYHLLILFTTADNGLPRWLQVYTRRLQYQDSFSLTVASNISPLINSIHKYTYIKTTKVYIIGINIKKIDIRYESN